LTARSPKPHADPTLDLALQPSGLEGMPAPPASNPRPTVDARHPAAPHPTAPLFSGPRATGRGRGMPPAPTGAPGGDPDGLITAPSYRDPCQSGKAM
jgi:hypothetical protein